MPYYWTIMPTGTPDELKNLTAPEFKRRIHEKFSREGAGLEDLYFDLENQEAYALIHAPAGRADLAGLAAELESSAPVELLSVEEMPDDWKSGGGSYSSAD